MTGMTRKRSRFVFVEWREGGLYRGAEYAESELPKLLAALRARRSQGIDIQSVSVDDRDVPL